MSDINTINSSTDYDAAVSSLADLIECDPDVGTAEHMKILVLTSLIEDYESSTLPDLSTDPIEAIKLRMDQLGIGERELAEILGSRSRVSEVMSGKRKLSVTMIKNLEEGLDIPASILIGSDQGSRKKRWSPRTLKTMASRGYFGDKNKEMLPNQIVESGLLKSLFSSHPLVASALLRQSQYRNIATVDKYHMEAWANKVLHDAKKIIGDTKNAHVKKGALNPKSMSEIFKLSVNDDGPSRAVSQLLSNGIVVVVEPHLPSTKLDGATFFTDKNIIIGLTLRHDRLDNFWFTLAHELAHAYLHQNVDVSAFYDQLFIDDPERSDLETEADQLAGELLIPSEVWARSALRYGSTPTLVKMYARQIGVHESIVAGRIRHDSNNWSIHSDLVKKVSVRGQFGEKTW